MNLAGAKYRITYEAFSKFSGSLGKADSIDMLGEITNRHLKYLFNFRAFRILLLDNNSISGYTFSKGTIYAHNNCENILDYEKELLEKQTPFSVPVQQNALPVYLPEMTLQNGVLWGWYIAYPDYRICVSLLSDDNVKFNHTDADIMHMLVDSLTSKYRQICLSEELKCKNETLQDAIAEIELKNKEIEAINSNQQSVINSRTQELINKNKKLLDLSRLNSHNLREPLTRILGLIEVADHLDDSEFKETMLPEIKTSALELDTIFKEVVQQSEEEVNALIYKEGSHE